MGVAKNIDNFVKEWGLKAKILDLVLTCCHVVYY
jgi:hypothetical protein